MSKQINIKSLLKKYKTTIINSKKLIFDINTDVYNITAPFWSLGKEYIAGRVEKRDGHDSKIMFFTRLNGKYVVDKKAPVFNLEDPFVCFIYDKIIFGGVKVSRGNYRTVFFKGKDIYHLKKFKTGPKAMKDIRLVLLSDKRIGIFTRPQGKIGGRGRIGFMIISSIKEFANLSEGDFYSAKLIPDSFDKGEWLGVNAIYVLKNNNLGVIGHIANFSKNGERNYYVISFTFDYLSNNFSNMKIIATRDELPKGESKREDLRNVLFPGGLIRKDGISKLYVGVSDAEAYEILIKDPFAD